MKLIPLVLAAILAVTACSATDIMRMAKPAPGIDADVQVGRDASKQIVLGDQNRNEVRANDVSGDLNSTSNVVSTQFTGNMSTGSFTINNMPTQKLLMWGGITLFLLGVLFPSPFEMWRWLKGQVLLIRGKKQP